MRALAVDPTDRWEHIGIMGADIETIAEGHLGSSAALAALVVGREPSRDSFSSEVTTPKASGPSLIPISSSIPADEPPTVPGSRAVVRSVLAREADVRSGEVAASHDEVEPMPIGMSSRRRRNIFVSAISLCVVLLGFAGLKAFGRRSVSTVSSNVLAPGQTAATELRSVPSVLDEPMVGVLPTVASAGAAPPPPPPPIPSIEYETRQPRPLANTGAVGVAAPASSRGASAKPKLKGEDPFGLMKPVVKPKSKDDPFGL
jgi:hypothetical protein